MPPVCRSPQTLWPSPTSPLILCWRRIIDWGIHYRRDCRACFAHLLSRLFVHCPSLWCANAGVASSCYSLFVSPICAALVNWAPSARVCTLHQASPVARLSLFVHASWWFSDSASAAGSSVTPAHSSRYSQPLASALCPRRSFTSLVTSGSLVVGWAASPPFLHSPRVLANVNVLALFATSVLATGAQR